MALGIADDDRDIDEEERSEAVSDILATLRDTSVPAGWEGAEWTGFSHGCAHGFSTSERSTRLPVGQPADEALSDEFDELSLGPVAVELDRHGHAVGARARSLAERIGLPDNLLEVAERAATLHDLGKADARFQRWLDPRRESGPLLAKSDAPRHRWEAMRVSSGWPREDGTRSCPRGWCARGSRRGLTGAARFNATSWSIWW